LCIIAHLDGGVAMMQPSPQMKRKSRSISFRLSEADYARLAYQAAGLNLRVNDLARRLALNGTDPLAVKTYRQNDPALIQQLLHVGHNLNQLTKNAHIFGRISPQVPALCQRIERIIDQALEEKGGCE